MRTVPILFAVAACAMVAMPVGAASWSSSGGFEPDNNLDNSAFIWADKPGAVTNRVYFNGFANEGGVFVGQGQNLNVAALETRNPITGNEGYLAILGNWVDCNGDGYIGLAESALREYPSELLASDAICPAKTGSEITFSGSHNLNGWVSELIPIGGNSLNGDGTPETDDNTRDYRVIRDTQAAIWGDYGRPNDGGPESGGGTCPISFPRGTFKDTGGALSYVDCLFGTTALLNRAFDDEPTTVGDVVVAGPGDPLGLGWSDVNDSRSGAIGQISTFGDDDSEHAAVTTSSCNGDRAVYGRDVIEPTPAGETLEDSPLMDFTIWAPSPALGNTADPTVAGQVNQTSEETEFNSDGCDTSNDAGQDFYGALGESNFDGVSVNDKRQSDFNMGYSDSNRGDSPWSFLNVASPRRGSAVHGNSFGVSYDWGAGNILVGQTPNRPTVRAGLNTDDPTQSNPGVVDATPSYISFYAFVGSATTSKGYVLPGSPSGAAYGSAQCASFTSGVHAGWNCDVTTWNMNADGLTPIPQEEGGNGVPGKIYNLRDVDCADGSNNLGVPTAPAAIGTDRCIAYGS